MKISFEFWASFLPLLVMPNVQGSKVHSCPISSPKRQNVLIMEKSFLRDYQRLASYSATAEPYFVTGHTHTFIRVIEGEPANLSCQVANLGDMGVVWYKNKYTTQKPMPIMEGSAITAGNKKIGNTRGDFFLHVTNSTFRLEFHHINRNDAGNYTCSVNLATELLFRVEVSYPATIQNILPNKEPHWNSRNPKRIYFNETDNVTLTCDVSAFPQPFISWNRHGGPDVEKCSEESFTILNVSRDQSGTYVCHAINALKKETSREIELVIQYAPEVSASDNYLTAGVGKYLLLECQVDAVPAAQVYWLKDGLIVSTFSSGSRYVIISLDPNTDYGNYTCVASNSLGSANAVIQVSGRPPRPQIVSDPQGTKRHLYTLTWRNSMEEQNTLQDRLKVGTFTIHYTRLKIEHVRGELQRLQMFHMHEYYTPDGWQEKYEFTLRDLSENTSYEVQLCPTNMYGSGECAEFTFRTSSVNHVASTPRSKISRNTNPPHHGPVIGNTSIQVTPATLQIIFLTLLPYIVR